MKKRLLYLALALIAAPLLWGQSTVVCTTASPGTVIGSCASGFSSPVTTDPLSFDGVVTFNNSANTPVTLSDGAAGGTLCSVGVADTANSVCVGSSAITGEGSSADGNEGVLAFGNASADNTLTLLATASGVELNPTTGALLTAAGTGTGRVSVGGVLCKGAPAQATTGTTEQVLATCTIPANTLSANGSAVLFKFFAHTAANANNKQLRIRVGGIGGTVVCDSTAVAANNLNITTPQNGTVARTGATTATAFCASWQFTNAASSATISTTVYSAQRAAAVTWANANDLVITGTTPTAAGDLTLDSYTVEVVQ